MKASAKSLRFLGEGKKLTIPFFQRKYVWKEENWNELLITFQNKEIKPFLGSIIIKHISQTEDYVIDGQQRLTTITILAKAIYDSLPDDKKNSNSGIRTNIENFLFYKDNSADDFEDSHVKIEHSILDSKDYKKVIMSCMLKKTTEIPLDTINEESGRILACYKYYREKLSNFSTEELKGLFNSLFNEDRKVFVLIELENEGINEQNIFDTINRAGVHLNTADIIKNNLFKRLLDSCDTCDKKENITNIYLENWENIFNKNQATSNVWDTERKFGNITHTNLEFLLYCVACIKWGESGDMFAKLESVFDKNTLTMEYYELLSLVTEIKDYALIFKKYILDFKENLDDESVDVYFKYEDYINRLMLILQKFGVQMFYPYVLKRLYETKQNSESPDLKHDFHILESFVMRRKISSRGTHDYTTKCYEIIKNGVELLFNNNELEITDLAVSRALDDTEDNTAKMILFWIEMYRRNKVKYDVDALEFAYTLEHIMPRKWETNWSDVDIISNGEKLNVNSDDGKLFRNTAIQSIGNKTLLTSSLNSAVKNSCFSDKINGINDKRPGYKKHTGLLITKEIVDNANNNLVWNELHIEKRKNELFKEFIEIWPYFKNDDLLSDNVDDNANSDLSNDSTVDDFTSEQFDDATKLLEALENTTYSKQPIETSDSELKNVFLAKVKDKSMSYSYKPVFIKALFSKSDESGNTSLIDVAMYFIQFYKERLIKGLFVENPDSVFSKYDCTIDEAIKVIKMYPLNIYMKTNTITYNKETNMISIVKDVWEKLSKSEIENILSICDSHLDYYFNRHKKDKDNNQLSLLT